MISWFQFYDIIYDFAYGIGYDIIWLGYIIILISWFAMI
jgi:hypothetical protein